MKQYITGFSLLILLIAGSSANAQVRRLAVGVKGGYNFSWVNLSNAEAVKGLAFGITSEYWLNSYSAISVDILYSEEGYEVPTTVIDYTYFQVPILYNTILGSATNLFRPKLGLGFSPGFLSKAEINGVDFKDQNSSTVLNLVGGVGSIVNLSSGVGLVVEARAYVGLTSPELNSNPDPIKNRTFQVNLGVVFGL